MRITFRHIKDRLTDKVSHSERYRCPPSPHPGIVRPRLVGRVGATMETYGIRKPHVCRGISVFCIKKLRADGEDSKFFKLSHICVDI